ncbi:MAG TPA: hypothetical protein VGK04_01490 [Thermoanaerobaculia bacterium]
MDSLHEILAASGHRLRQRFVDFLAAPAKLFGQLLKVVVHTALSPSRSAKRAPKSVNCCRVINIRVRPNVLVVSSDLKFAGMLERQLRAEFEVHAAESDDLAFALMDANLYRCVVVDLRAGATTVRLNALTVPTIVLIPAGAETLVPETAHAYINDGSDVRHLADAIREVCREESAPQS